MRPQSGMQFHEAKLDIFDGADDDDEEEIEVEGEMHRPGYQPISQHTAGGLPAFNTLDEPIRATVMRDLRAVGSKFAYVLCPKEKSTLLKEWDLWGPLLLCTLMAMILQGTRVSTNDQHDGGPEFAEVFVIVWIGSLIVTINSKLLGGNISLFQSVCVLGYCLLPTTIALIVCRIILLAHQTTLLFAIRLTVAVIGYAWATYASMVFLGGSQPPGRMALAVYPISLFYLVISWLVISHSNVY